MRVLFLVALLGGAIFYAYIAFMDLNFMTRTGRLGPGFFPRVIGVSGIVITLLAIFEELRNKQPQEGSAEQWREFGFLVALALCYAVLLRLFGGYVATALFLVVTLAHLNRGRLMQNLLIAVLVPVGIYFLFDKVLNASMPPALFALPI